MKAQKKGGWLAAKVSNELVMMSAREGNYIGLNSVGSRIWELLAEPRDLDALCRQLESEFDVSHEECLAEVQSFLKELERHGAVALVAPTA